MNHRYRLTVYGDVNQSTVLMVKNFYKIQDIIRFTNNRVTYNDTKRKHGPKRYKTYKNLFSVIKL